MKKIEVIISLFVSILLIGLSYFKLVPFALTEVFGFITGGLCVWLVVKQNIWNWPVGIANNIFFIILFFQSRLFADMGLQFIYIILSVIGWHFWLKGGKDRTELTVTRAPVKLMFGLMFLLVVSTGILTYILIQVNDSAPFLDALTTMLSLAAQFLLTKKYIQNWYFWIIADVIYIYLYFAKGLGLTAVLYAVFLSMCLIGLNRWRKSL